MYILLTNDDGINSEGIQKLAKALRSKGKYKVTVLAPDSNRSGISHAVSILSRPVKMSKLGEETWSCSGYPVDCVILAILGALPEKPDLVLSGINKGENLGTDIVYSGTAAAARQASLAGIPAVALSLAGDWKEVFHWDMAVSWSADHLEELAAFWVEDTFVNVNIPNSPEGPEGIIRAWPAVKRYRDTLAMMPGREDNRWYFVEFGQNLAETEPGSDCDAVSRNFVSVSSVYNYPVENLVQPLTNGQAQRSFPALQRK